MLGYLHDVAVVAIAVFVRHLGQLMALAVYLRLVPEHHAEVELEAHAVLGYGPAYSNADVWAEAAHMDVALHVAVVVGLEEIVVVKLHSYLVVARLWVLLHITVVLADAPEDAFLLVLRLDDVAATEIGAQREVESGVLAGIDVEEHVSCRVVDRGLVVDVLRGAERRFRQVELRMIVAETVVFACAAKIEVVAPLDGGEDVDARPDGHIARDGCRHVDADARRSNVQSYGQMVEDVVVGRDTVGRLLGRRRQCC